MNTSKIAMWVLSMTTALLPLALPAAADTITVLNFANYMPEDLPAKFKQATGYDMELVTTGNNEDTMGRLTASNGTGFDVVFVSSPFAEALNKLGMLDKLDQTLLPNTVNLYEQAKVLSFDPGNTFSVPYAWGTTGLCYREDLVKTAPTSWWDLLKPSDDLKGKITMLSTDRWLLAAGQLANGFKVNDVTPEHLQKVKTDLIAAKKTILAYDDITFYSKLVSGEASMVHAWDGWCNYAVTDNDKVKFVIPKEGSDFFVDVMTVPKAAEHKKAAHAFINFILKPENQGWVAQQLFFKVPNKPAMESLPADLLKKYTNMNITPAELAKFDIFHDLGADQPAVTKIVTEIKSAQ